jgi:hypothetical protein
MSGALDHFLNALNIALKAGERREAELHEREKRAQRPASRQRSFSGPSLGDDPSCCLARRKIGGPK